MVRSIAIDAKKGNEEKDRIKLHEYPSLSSYPEPQTKHTLKYSLASPLAYRFSRINRTKNSTSFQNSARSVESGALVQYPSRTTATPFDVCIFPLRPRRLRNAAATIPHFSLRTVALRTARDPPAPASCSSFRSAHVSVSGRKLRESLAHRLAHGAYDV